MSFEVSGFELSLWWFFQLYLAGAIASLASTRGQSSSFYLRLRRPQFAPPAWLFGPVWGVLYGIMAYAAYRVRRQGAWETGENFAALVLFEIFIVFVTAWSWLFFNRKWLLVSLIDIIIAWILGIITVVLFWTVDWIAGILMLIPLAWITFATLLMFFIWNMNRGRAISCDNIVSDEIDEEAHEEDPQALRSGSYHPPPPRRLSVGRSVGSGSGTRAASSVVIGAGGSGLKIPG